MPTLTYSLDSSSQKVSSTNSVVVKNVGDNIAYLTITSNTPEGESRIALKPNDTRYFKDLGVNSSYVWAMSPLGSFLESTAETLDNLTESEIATALNLNPGYMTEGISAVAAAVAGGATSQQVSDAIKWVVGESKFNLVSAGLTSGSSNAWEVLNNMVQEANGAKITWPYSLDCFVNLDNGPISIPHGGLHLDVFGTIRLSRSSSPESLADEGLSYLFSGVDVEAPINIQGGKRSLFDGQRFATVNPKAALLRTYACPDVTCNGVTFEDVDNYNYCLHASSHSDARDISILANFDGNKYRRCCNGSTIRGLADGSSMSYVKGFNFDLSNANGGIVRYTGETAFVGRGLRYTGYSATDSSLSSDGEIFGISMNNNVITNATYCIEAWNTSPSGYNPESAKGVALIGNNVKGLFGIGTNAMGQNAISSNSVSFTKLDAIEMLDYAGVSYLTDTSVSGGNGAGTGLEMLPGYGSCSNNTIDLGYDPLAALDYTASSLAVSMGDSDLATCQWVCSNLNIKRARYGLSLGLIDNCIFNNLSIEQCGTPIDCKEAGSGVNKKNILSNSKIRALPWSSFTGSSCVFRGGWLINGSEFTGDASDPIQVPLLIFTSDVDVEFKSNTVFNFVGRAIEDRSISSIYDGNTYNDGAGRPASKCIRVVRQNGKTMHVGTEINVNSKIYIEWDNTAGATTDTYNFDRILLNRADSYPYSFKSTASEIKYVPAYFGKKDLAPTAGYWPAGARLSRPAPSSGSSEGLICTVSGSAGTWSSYGAVL
jgi:hypothetical protein